MSSPIRVTNAIVTKLTEIAGLLTVKEKRPVSVGEAAAWVFNQLPEDYLEKLKEQALYPPGGPDQSLPTSPAG